MGSSAMGSSLLKNKFKKESLAIEVNNSAINQIPDDADIVITHKNLTDRAKTKIHHNNDVSVKKLENRTKYDELIAEVKDEYSNLEEALPAETAQDTESETPETVNKIIFASDAGMGSSAMGASLLKNKFKKENIDIEVTNSAINQIPDDADIVITHKNLTDRAKTK